MRASFSSIGIVLVSIVTSTLAAAQVPRWATTASQAEDSAAHTIAVAQSLWIQPAIAQVYVLGLYGSAAPTATMDAFAAGEAWLGVSGFSPSTLAPAFGSDSESKRGQLEAPSKDAPREVTRDSAMRALPLSSAQGVSSALSASSVVSTVAGEAPSPPVVVPMVSTLPRSEPPPDGAQSERDEQDSEISIRTDWVYASSVTLVTARAPGIEGRDREETLRPNAALRGQPRSEPDFRRLLAAALACSALAMACAVGVARKRTRPRAN